jgi:AbrB family looped-hinge helix DNA binding protein
MCEVTVSPKYQIVIPQEIREAAHITPGKKFGMMVIGKSIKIFPIIPLEELYGSAHGIDTTIEREEDREL